nr:hypothetical protein [Tanacetum cinerariifolium]
DTDDESDDQELEAHYMYMAKLQQVSLDVNDSGPIFDKEPEQKVNAHLYADYKKSKEELKRRNTVEYAMEMELACAKLRGELITNEMERK